jgi:hypothetical protein
LGASPFGDRRPRVTASVGPTGCRGGQMKSGTKLVLVGSITFAIGLVGGGAAGLEIASRISLRLSQPLMTASGHQPFVVLTLLDRREESKLRDFLEMDIDATLLSLRTMEKDGSIDPTSPIWLVYSDLKEYRAQHPKLGPPARGATE